LVHLFELYDDARTYEL